MERAYEVGAAARVRARHRMPVEGPEGRLHAHDYRIEARVEREELDERGMVCDLDVLRDALRRATERIEGRDLEEIRPAWAEAVTVEVLARWLHGELADPVREDGGGLLSVRVWESASEYGGYRGHVA